LAKVTCHKCGEKVDVSVAWIFPDGDTRVVQSHGSDKEVNCSGSLEPVK
jgi:hypothetical protein